MPRLKQLNWRLRNMGIASSTKAQLLQSATSIKDAIMALVADDVVAPPPPPVEPPPTPVGTAPAFSGSGFSLIETAPLWDWTTSMMEPSRANVVSFTTYEVGPGKAYAELADVPWLSLKPGDVVKVYWRPTPYKDLIWIGVRGAWAQWITIQGIKDPTTNKRPQISGDGARLASNAATAWGYNTQWMPTCAMIAIGKPMNVGAAWGYKPGYIHISGFEFLNAHGKYKRTDHTGKLANWDDFTPAIDANPVEHLAVTDCIFHDNGQGVFINSGGDEAGQSRWILIRGNYFYNNGVVNKASMHNAYTEAAGVVYEYNYFDAPITGTGGDNIKERSAGIVFRNNLIRNGVNLISLRDPQSNGTYEGTLKDKWGVRLASQAYIYNNVFVIDAPTIYNEAPIVVAHGDGVSFGDGKQIRDGYVDFYRNKVVCSFDYRDYGGECVPLFDPINTRAPTTWRCVNNLFYGKAATANGHAAPFALFYWQGVAEWHNNWTTAFVDVFADTADGGLASGTKFNGTGLGGLVASTESPMLNVDYTPQANSPWHSLNGAYSALAIERGLLPSGNPATTHI